MSIALSTELQRTTLENLQGLPPLDYLFCCDTPDQEAHWHDLKYAYQWLGQAFKDYFATRPTQLDGLSESDCEFYGLYSDYYLSWYGVVQWGWRHIQVHAEKNGVDLAQDLKIGTPGEAFIKVLQLDCAATMESAFLPYHRWTPHQQREITRLTQSIERDRKLGKVKVPQENKLRSLKAQSTQWSDDFTFIRRALIAICCVSQAKDATLKRHLKSFALITAQLSANFQARIHRSKGVLGFEWIEGKKLFLGPQGGATLNKTSK